MAITIREATEQDVLPLVQLNRLAYPSGAEDNLVWGASHLRSHQRIFPQGQLVAELDGELVGAAASLIVDLGSDPHRLHTWAGITDSGYFTNHDPGADTLYGADIYVHPKCRGQGVGRALHDARRELCRRLNLRRILAGGRLVGYSAVAEQMSAEEYARRVADGALKDPVLNFQLRDGFQLRGVLPNYLRDPASRNFASLIEWINPDYKPRRRGRRKVRVACVQYKMRRVGCFDDFARQARYYADVANNYGSDFLLFPELFTLQLLSIERMHSALEGIRRLSDYTDELKHLMSGLARDFGLTIIAGSHPVPDGDKMLNMSMVCLPDGRIVAQPKLHITPNERRWWGISGGSTLGAIDTPFARIGVLICYDIEFPEAARVLADDGAEIIFVPFCTDHRQSYLRVRHCAAARAIENQIYVAMAGNVGALPDVVNLDVNYGQACVLTPSDFEFARDGIAAEADTNDETVIVCDLDLDDLVESRSGGTVTPRRDRRSDLFQIITPFPPKPRVVYEPGEGPRGDQPAGD